MSTATQQRAEAELTRAIASMAPAMKVALKAAHTLMEINKDLVFDRVAQLQLEVISELLGSMCPAQARVLCEIFNAHFVGEEHHDEEVG